MRTLILVPIFLFCTTLVVLAQTPEPPPPIPPPLVLPRSSVFFSKGEWKNTIIKNSEKPGGVMVASHSVDYDLGGFLYSIIKSETTVYAYEPKDRWGWETCYGKNKTYYPNENDIDMSKGDLPGPDTHSIWLYGYNFDRPDEDEFLQKDPEWADEPYGKYDQSTVGAEGCFFIGALRQVNFWGIPTSIWELLYWMDTEEKAYLADGISTNIFSIAEYCLSRGIRMRVAEGWDVDEILDRGYFPNVWVGGNGGPKHWVNAWGHIFENKKMSYLICDSEGDGISSSVYPGFSKGVTWTLYPYVHRDKKTKSASASIATEAGLKLTADDPASSSLDIFYSSNVVGKVELQNFSGTTTNINGIVTISNGLDAEVHNIILDESGNYTFGTGLSGFCAVSIKCSNWLIKVIYGTVKPGNNTLDIATLTNGDVMNNNEVDFSDINAVRAAYGSMPGDETWNERADVDGSGEVDFTDINIVRAQYGEIGETLPDIQENKDWGNSAVIIGTEVAPTGMTMILTGESIVRPVIGKTFGTVTAEGKPQISMTNMPSGNYTITINGERLPGEEYKTLYKLLMYEYDQDMNSKTTVFEGNLFSNEAVIEFYHEASEQ